jgi:hypothetical protein
MEPPKQNPGSASMRSHGPEGYVREPAGTRFRCGNVTRTADKSIG